MAYAKSELVSVVGLLSSQSKAHGIAASDQNSVDICRYRSPPRLPKNSSTSGTYKPRAPSAALPNRSVRPQALATCVASVRRRLSRFGDICVPRPSPIDRPSDNSSVISDSMRQKPKGIAFPESTQPIKIQEEGTPLWPNKGVLNALPQEPSFGRFFTGFDPTSLPSPCRSSYLYRLFEAFRPNRRPRNPPLQTVLSNHRRARLRQLRQPNPSTKRFLCHGSPTAPRS